MRDYFVKLLNYDKHNNLQMAQMIIDAGSPDRSVQLMAHVLGAQKVWLSRCAGDPTLAAPIWPDWKSDVFEQTINANANGWLKFVESLIPADFERVINYTDSRGNSHQNKLEDILAHLINHGTHHRAQMGQYLKQSGAELPFTDYIFYIREHGN